MQTTVYRTVVSSGREEVTFEYANEPGVFYIPRRTTAVGLAVSGPFDVSDPRFKVSGEPVCSKHGLTLVAGCCNACALPPDPARDERERKAQEPSSIERYWARDTTARMHPLGDLGR